MNLKTQRRLAALALVVYLAALAFTAGPARWELAHSYEHWIAGAGSDLPSLTRTLALPVLGLGPSTLTVWAVRVLFWGLVWLGPLALLAVTWRARTTTELGERLLLGGALYGASMLLAGVVLLVAVWLPFALL